MRNDGRVISVRSAFASMTGGFLAVSTAAPRSLGSDARMQDRRPIGDRAPTVGSKSPVLEPIG